MTPKKLPLVVSALAAASAFAQAPLGSVTTVQGVVTATQGATGVTVTPGTLVQNGMRFVTTSRGSVTLQLNSGCIVTVPPSHGVTVLQSMTCQQLTAAVQPVVPLAAVAQLTPNPVLVNGVIGLTGVSVLVGGVTALNKNEPLSGQ